MEPPTERKYPLHMPSPDHKPPVPRFMLKLPDEIKELYTVYVGAQQHGGGAVDASTASQAYSKAIELLDNWVQKQPSPRMAEAFEVISGYDIPGSRVWVLYYSSQSSFDSHLSRLSLPSLQASLGAGHPAVGVWREHFTTPIERVETNYSGQDYGPGINRFPGSKTYQHQYSAYWGAARDRIPAAAWDAFSRPADANAGPSQPRPRGLDEHLSGAAPFDNVVHIRSGQFWQRADARERETYETQLEPALQNGLAYLHDNPAESGNLGLRFLRSLQERAPGVAEIDGVENGHVGGEWLRETCAAGFFRNLEDLERWTQSHESHHAIYNGAMAHGKKFDNKHKFRTWHEVSVMKKGEARFEYVNCTPETGAIQFLPLERKA